VVEQRTEELLQELSDREAIRYLVNRYCQVLWREELDEYPKLYAEDAILRWTNPGRTPVQGRTALREMIGTMVHAHRKPRQFLHNHTVQLLGPDTAKGQCCTEVRNILDGKEGYIVCYYEDDYVKIDGEWKFKVREVTIEYFGPRTGYLPPSDKTTASWFQ
jgi:uncharacterized protein (TIGR02246 family)